MASAAHFFAGLLFPWLQNCIHGVPVHVSSTQYTSTCADHLVVCKACLHGSPEGVRTLILDSRVIGQSVWKVRYIISSLKGAEICGGAVVTLVGLVARPCGQHVCLAHGLPCPSCASCCSQGLSGSCVLLTQWGGRTGNKELVNCSPSCDSDRFECSPICSLSQVGTHVSAFIQAFFCCTLLRLLTKEHSWRGKMLERKYPACAGGGWALKITVTLSICGWTVLVIACVTWPPLEMVDKELPFCYLKAAKQRWRLRAMVEQVSWQRWVWAFSNACRGCSLAGSSSCSRGPWSDRHNPGSFWKLMQTLLLKSSWTKQAPSCAAT